MDITVAIDKIDKIGIDNVNAELREKGLTEEAIEKLRPILEMNGSNDDKLAVMADILKNSEEGIKGVDEMRQVLAGIEALGHKCVVEADLSLARGLNYYTGTIIEVKALIFLSMMEPSSSSLSPTMATNGIFSASASAICFFNFAASG